MFIIRDLVSLFCYLYHFYYSILSEMESAVKASSLPETICGTDESVQVLPMTSPPYKWICFLKITDVNGTKLVGSGFKIYLPDVDRTAIVTSGHCTYIKGAYATHITVELPGKAPIGVGAAALYASPEYINNGSADHDYGLILLPGDSKDGFGWSAIVADNELDNRLVTNCGFPGDKPRNTMWITGGEITRYTTNRIYYMNDTMAGQSGSPVYTWYGGYWTVLAVHSYGGCPNSAPRFTFEMVSRFLRRMNCLEPKALKSVQFPNAYLRCDGNGVTRPEGNGGGTVNCQYNPPKSYEKFYICPVQVTPSLAIPTVCTVVIESAQFKDVFIRLDGSGMKKFEGPGGGVVNCQFRQRSYERFEMHKNPNGAFVFQSVSFPHCLIRLNGSGVVKFEGAGSGIVNCQYYEDPLNENTPWEYFNVEKVS